MGFKVMFNFNMQFALIGRSLIRRLQNKGLFFQSPYPDYYAMTVSLLLAERILAVPFPLVVVGITPKSFGYYYFNQKENEGTAFLKNMPEGQALRGVEKFLMPGTNMNSSWLLAMETIKNNFGREYGLDVDYKKYRLLQILSHYKEYALRALKTKDLFRMSSHLSFREKIVYFIPFFPIALCLRMCPKKGIRNGLSQKIVLSFSHPQYTMKQIKGRFENILDVFEQTASKSG